MKSGMQSIAEGKWMCWHWQTKSGKISTQPHSTLCIQFLDRENNDKNNTLPLGKQICFTIVWGCAEILPKTFLLLINKHSWLRGDHCVGFSLTPPTGSPISSPLTSGYWLSSAVFSHPCESTGASRVFSHFTNISKLLSPVRRLPSWALCLCRGRVFFTLLGRNIFSFLVVPRRAFFMSLLVFDFDVPSWFLLVRWQSCDCFSSRRACLSFFLRWNTGKHSSWKSVKTNWSNVWIVSLPHVCHYQYYGEQSSPISPWNADFGGKVMSLDQLIT